MANHVDIGLYEGHCFNIKDLDILTNHWECGECQQRFIRHDNYDRHIAEELCTGSQPKLVCLGKKLNTSWTPQRKSSMAKIHSSHGKVTGGSSSEFISSELRPGSETISGQKEFCCL